MIHIKRFQNFNNENIDTFLRIFHSHEYLRHNNFARHINELEALICCCVFFSVCVCSNMNSINLKYSWASINHNSNMRKENKLSRGYLSQPTDLKISKKSVLFCVFIQREFVYEHFPKDVWELELIPNMFISCERMFYFLLFSCYWLWHCGCDFYNNLFAEFKEKMFLLFL